MTSHVPRVPEGPLMPSQKEKVKSKQTNEFVGIVRCPMCNNACRIYEYDFLVKEASE